MHRDNRSETGAQHLVSVSCPAFYGALIIVKINCFSFIHHFLDGTVIILCINVLNGKHVVSSVGGLGHHPKMSHHPYTAVNPTILSNGFKNV